MEAAVRTHTADADPAAIVATQPEMECRLCELEAENARLRLLVSELLVLNQRLREGAEAVRKVPRT